LNAGCFALTPNPPSAVGMAVIFEKIFGVCMTENRLLSNV
jgi:hypothetical protein